jgi:hypothetical protein
MKKELKKLTSGSVIYGLGSILQKALAFFLLPIYTHHLSTSDFSSIDLSKIKIIVSDVDDVLTDSGMYYSEKGDELKNSILETERHLNCLKSMDI